MPHPNMIEIEATTEFVTAHADLWPQAQQVSQAIFHVTRPAMEPAFAAQNLADGRLASALISAYGLDPDPISGQLVCLRAPYATPASRARNFAALADQGLMLALNDTDYQLTSDGRKIVIHWLGVFYDQLRATQAQLLEHLPAAELAALARALTTIVTAALNGPIANWGTRASHRLTPPADVALAQIDQALDDLNAFRDDAHIASWQPHGVSGPAWEFFTHLWRGEVKTVAEMTEKAGAARGCTLADYEAAVAELLDRAWVEPAEAGYALTATGRHIRTEAEALTDRYFFAPWTALPATELAALRASLHALTEHLTVKAA